MRGGWVVGGAVLAVVLAGCTVSDGGVSDGGASTGAASAGPTRDQARAYILGSLESRVGGLQQSVPEQSLADLLPNHEFAIDGAKAQALSPGLVIGTVTSAEAGRSYTVDGEDAASGIEGPFTDEAARWRVAVITIEPDSAFGDVAGEGDVHVGVVVDGGLDPRDALASLAALGRVAVVLGEDGRYAFAPDAWSIRQSGALLGVIDDEGTLSFPALGVDEEAFLSGITTVRELEGEARVERAVTKVSVESGEFVRETD